MYKRCQFPDCPDFSKHTWANVPLCTFHYETIMSETEEHYAVGNRRFSYEDRYFYLKIAHLIPWSQVNQRRKSS